MTPATRCLVTHRTYDRPSILPPRFSRRKEIESHLHLASGLSCIKSFLFFPLHWRQQYVWAEFCPRFAVRHQLGISKAVPVYTQRPVCPPILSSLSIPHLNFRVSIRAMFHKQAWGDRRFVKSNDREAHDPSALHDHKVRVTEQP